MLQLESRMEIKRNQVLTNFRQLDQTIMVNPRRQNHSELLEQVGLLGVHPYINLIMQTHNNLQHEVHLPLTREGKLIPRLRQEKTFLVRL